MKIYESFSTERSGHHTVLYWLCHQHKCIKIPAKPILETAGNIYWDYENISLVIKDNINRLQYTTLDYNNHIPLNIIKKCSTYIVAYEIVGINNSYYQDIQHNFPNTPIQKLIILRDLYNTVASYARFRSFHDSAIQDMVNLWTSLAQKVLQTTDTSIYFINYNDYHHKIEYRQKICSDLNLDFTDHYLNYITPQGNGSSFSKRGILNKQLLNTRYQSYVSNSDFINLINNNIDSFNLSNQLFKMNINI
jgi:hypothetical protein